MFQAATRIAHVLGGLGEVRAELIDGNVCHNYYEDDFDTMGDVMGYDFQTVGQFGRAVPARPGGVMPALGTPAKLVRPGAPGRPTPVMLPPRPVWRPQVAPGVPYPGEGIQMLPLTPSAGNGVFVAALNTITFTARPQVPFRSERLIATVRRTGAAGVIILATTFQIGRQNQMVQTGSFDIEQFSATAFGVRLALDPAEPGIDITVVCSASPAVGGADTVAVSLLLLGRAIR